MIKDLPEPVGDSMIALLTFKAFFIESFSHVFLPKTSIEAIGAFPLSSSSILSN